MTGPEHYRHAESWLKFAEDTWSDPENHDPDVELSLELHAEARTEASFYVQIAQAHATLAHTAVAARTAVDSYLGDDHDITDWATATGVTSRRETHASQ